MTYLKFQDWTYREDCAAKADGLICTYIPSEHTSDTSQGPAVVPGNKGQLGNGTVAEILGVLKDINKKMGENMGEMDGTLTVMEEALLKEFKGVKDNLQGMDKKIDDNNGEIGEGLKGIEEALEGVNDNLHQLIEELEQRNDDADKPVETAPSQNQDTPGGTESNGGETGIGGILGSSWNNHFPSWMNDTNFPFGKR